VFSSGVVNNYDDIAVFVCTCEVECGHAVCTCELVLCGMLAGEGDEVSHLTGWIEDA